jgi:hypothetical protein
MMYRQSNSGINLNFNNVGCTSTISLNRSFISLLSMDGNVTTLDGSSFHLIGSFGQLIKVHNNINQGVRLEEGMGV